MRIGAPAMKSSCKSFKQISRWSSPAPATMCSPEFSSEVQTTNGSDLLRRFKPSTSFCKSCAFLTSTATAQLDLHCTSWFWSCEHGSWNGTSLDDVLVIKTRCYLLTYLELAQRNVLPWWRFSDRSSTSQSSCLERTNKRTFRQFFTGENAAWMV